MAGTQDPFAPHGEGYPHQEPFYGQQQQYGQQQPQYAPAGYGYPPAVSSGYFPVQTSYGVVTVPLSSPAKRLGAMLLESVLAIVTLGIGYLIWTLIIWGKGQSPGKQVLGMKVVDSNTHLVADWGKMFVREFLIRGIVIGFISLFTLYIGFLVAAFMIFSLARNYQAGWDRIASTVVVDAAALPQR